MEKTPEYLPTKSVDGLVRDFLSKNKLDTPIIAQYAKKGEIATLVWDDHDRVTIYSEGIALPKFSSLGIADPEEVYFTQFLLEGLLSENGRKKEINLIARVNYYPNAESKYKFATYRDDNEQYWFIRAPKDLSKKTNQEDLIVINHDIDFNQ
ncbi:hypothetical protein CL617_01820 [archaeon]|jgi:hypothetical protein|nr:hypothetical protein [archaeon]|tara:strand:- start:14626 stop:15081 length:456 start_codon:yes stop_codon:yes gene_type:complete